MKRIDGIYSKFGRLRQLGRAIPVTEIKVVSLSDFIREGTPVCKCETITFTTYSPPEKK